MHIPHLSTVHCTTKYFRKHVVVPKNDLHLTTSHYGTVPHAGPTENKHSSTGRRTSSRKPPQDRHYAIRLIQNGLFLGFIKAIRKSAEYTGLVVNLSGIKDANSGGNGRGSTDTVLINGAVGTVSEVCEQANVINPLLSHIFVRSICSPFYTHTPCFLMSTKSIKTGDHHTSR